LGDAAIFGAGGYVFEAQPHEITHATAIKNQRSDEE
jgi:hypothetical protein